MSECFRILYTKHLTQRRRTYHDGFLKRKTSGMIILLSENGEVLATATLPSTVSLTDTTEDLREFEGFIVNCDGRCLTEEIPIYKQNSGDRSSGEAQIKPKSSLFKWTKITTCEHRQLNPGIKKRKLPEQHKVTQRRRTDDEILEYFRNPNRENTDINKTETVERSKRSSKSALNVSIKQEKLPQPRVKKSSLLLNGPKADLCCKEESLSLHFVLNGKKPKRSFTIPETYSELSEYQKHWRLLLQEEMQIKLDSFAYQIYCTFRRNSQKAESVSNALRGSGVQSHDHIKLEIFNRKEKDSKDTIFLTLHELSLGTRRSMRKQDVWVVSTDARFLHDWSAPGKKKKKIIDQLHGPWNVLFYSVWHQPSKDGRIQIELLSKTLPAAMNKQEKLYALHGPNLGLEISLWEALGELESIPPTLMEPLMNRRPLTRNLSCIPEDLVAQVNQIRDRFRLNNCQSAVLNHGADWLLKEPCNHEPVCLIHGPFGTGKSSLLIALIHLLTTLETKLRVLVCAHTNVAVDRVLQGLIDVGFTDFIRIGSSKKIAKSLLSYTVHSSDSDETEAISEFNKPAQAILLPSHEKSELKEDIQPQLEKRQQRLNSVNVVGVTCCSAESPLLSNQVFDVVILDECSQIIEPLSLLPLVKSKAKYLIAAGDPCQLPPVISSPSFRNQGLTKTLFTRLQNIGHIPHFLSTQYRCHPVLCHVPNKHFYEDKLRTGCSVKDREALIANWLPLCHLQIEGKVQIQRNTRSRWNKSEADAVIQLLRQIITQEISTDQVGVICFFKAQVTLIQSGLHDTIAESVQVATVDSFQGMEKDIIILSMSVDSSDAFASDNHRLNVALTRARHHLITVGNKRVLESISPCLQDLIQLSQNIPLEKDIQL